MSEIIHVLKRGGGRTVYSQRGRIIIRFDSAGDRERFEIEHRLCECVARQDIKGAARAVLDALNAGVADEDDLLALIHDKEVQKMIRLELIPMIEAALSVLEARIVETWPKDHD
jgi:hypothetical protein